MSHEVRNRGRTVRLKERVKKGDVLERGRFELSDEETLGCV